MKIIIISFLISFSALAQDKYVLPEDIIIARDKLIASKKKLDRDIFSSLLSTLPAKEN